MNLDYKVNPKLNSKKYIKSYLEDNFSEHLYDESIIRGNYCDCLISILFNTNNLDNTLFILKEFYKKTKKPEKIQFCIKIDNDNQQYVENFLKEISRIKFNFIIIASPKGRGFIDLWQWVNFLYKSSSVKSKFVMNISDEMYVKNKNWDTKLEKYINFYEDNIFRLRTSVFKNRNYFDLYECGYAPDTTAIYSRKYLEIQGDFSPCFGPDNGQQFVAFYLSKLNLPRHYQFLRDIVSEGIDFEGQGTNVGLTKEQKNNRENLNFLLWNNMFKYKFQNSYFQRARKIQLEIIKEKYKEIKVEDYGYKYHIILENNKPRKAFLCLNNFLPIWKIFIYKLSKIDFLKNNTGYSKSSLTGIFITLYFLIYKKIPRSESEDTEKGFFKLKDDILAKVCSISDLIMSKISDFFLSKHYSREKGLEVRIPFSIKNIILFVIFYIKITFLIVLFFLYHLYKPQKLFKNSIKLISLISFKKLYRLKSNIFTNNLSDQSKSVIVKGD